MLVNETFLYLANERALQSLWVLLHLSNVTRRVLTLRGKRARSVSRVFGIFQRRPAGMVEEKRQRSHTPSTFPGSLLICETVTMTQREKRVSAPVEATILSPWTGGIRLIPEGLNLDCMLKGSLVLQTSLWILRMLLISHDTAQRLSETPQANQ